MTGTLSSRTEAEAGFTLIELLVVIAIIGLLGAVAAAAWHRSPAVSPLHGAVMKARSSLQQARRDALASGHAVVVSADRVAPDARWRSGGDLVFYPDGSASGDVLVMAGQPRVEVDWLTGFVHDAT